MKPYPLLLAAALAIPSPAVAEWTPAVPAQLPAGIMRSPQAPRGNIYGIVNRFQGIQTTGEAYAAKINLATGAVSKLYCSPIFSPYTGEDYLLQTNTLRNGEIICPSLESFDDYNVSWDFIDLMTGRYLRTKDFGADMFANAYSMTYDPDHDLIYMVCLDGNTDGQFSIADPKKDYEITYVGSLRKKGGFIAALAYNTADGQLYAFNDNNNVFTLDPSSGALVEAGYLELPTGDLLFSEGISGQVTYSPADQMFICIYRDNSLEASRVLYIHPETFEIFEGAVLTADKVPYVSSVFCTDEYAEPDAPELPEEPEVSFVGPSLSGTLKVTAPRYTYIGTPLGSTRVKMKLTADGNSVFEKEMLPGASETVSLTLPEGDHAFVLTALLNNASSPERRFSVYVGNDSPQAPSGISLDGNLLSWQPVGSDGVHGGYVDTDAVTYQVYMDGVLQTKTPLAETSYSLTVPSDFDKREISVIASAHGVSSPAGTLSVLFGEALPLPFHHAPSNDETKYYSVVNANHDERTWFYTSSANSDDPDAALDPTLYGWCFFTGYMAKADDWLFLPPVNITNPEEVHTLSYSLRGIFTIPTVESYEIWIGRKPSPEAMLSEGFCILSDPHYIATTSPVDFTHNFGVPEAGAYYVAFRAMGSPETESQGILINTLDIASTGKKCAVPADPTNVSVIPADLGRKAILVSATLPVTDINGKQLPAAMQVTLTAEEGDSRVTATGLPGEKVSLELPVEKSGFHYPHLTPESADGKGYTRCYSMYAGLDRPHAPRNIRLTPTADNLSLKLQWEAPSTIGENGGYVDPDRLNYKIYARSDSNTAMLMGETTECEMSLSPFSVPNPPMTAFSFGVASSNEGGESYDTAYSIEQLGIPYELPMLEEWGQFSYSPYTAETTGRYAYSRWESVASMNGMNIGNPRFNNGGLIAYTEGGYAADAMVVLPKATTIGIAKADFILRYWDYPNAPEKITVYGRRFNETGLKVLGQFEMKHPAQGEWVNGTIHLPEGFIDSPWIEIRIGSRLIGAADEYLVFDSFQLIPDTQNDLKISSLIASDQICIGETLACAVTVANAGRTALGGSIALELRDKNGKVYASDKAVISPLQSNRTFEFSTNFDIDGSYRDTEGLQLVAGIDCSDDNLGNNTRSVPVTVISGTLPVVNDLTAVAADNGVGLNWSVPPTKYGDFESFEEFEPFMITDRIGQWQNFDLDGLMPITLTNTTTGATLAWPGSDAPQGWTVVDVEEIGLMQEERIRPHSGRKILVARSADYPEEGEPLQSSKWLVSPEIKGGSQLSFWMSTLASDLMEFIEIWYSTTDVRLDPSTATSTRNGSFRRLRTISKEGAETWELIKCALPSDAKYFAIRYNSYDSAAVMLDDISYTPLNMLDRVISHYSLYRSDNGDDFRTIADNITANRYTDTTRGDNNSIYILTTNVKAENGIIEGPASNRVYVCTSGTDSIEAQATVSALPGRIRISGLQGCEFAVVSADGITVASGKLASDSVSIAVEPGIYVVRAGDITKTLIIR